MEIRKIKNNEIEQMVPLRDYCFSRKYTGNKLTDYINWTQNSTNIGAFSNDKLVGQMMSLPLHQNLYNKTFKMAGVGFVGVYPEYRSGGVMKKIIQNSLYTMRKEGYFVSILGPFSVSYYRKMGWEVIFDSITYEIDMRDFPTIKLDHEISFQRYDFKDWPEKKVKELYNEVAKKKNGWMIRDDRWWERLQLREPDSYFVMVDDGFMRYRKSGTIFLIEDLVAKNFRAERELLYYITLHRSNFFTVKGLSSVNNSINYFLTSINCHRSVGNQFMGRIIDVEETLNYVPVKKNNQELFIQVDDPLCPWNNGLFEVKNGKFNKVENLNKTNDKIIITIQALSALFFGYKTVEELYYLNLISGNEKMIESLADIYQFQTVEIFDHF
ncbi:GNAT family N-acetyltransferase [Vagococcus lutrae]|uniref:GNAT family N-acetyltransferase n=1 Tax=Vagococcus lutrae TaxID=81947 RepID=UPI002890680C|nr:GNAT family N-acetyltransferase [Vagococcus lutrae]MDT2842709.1 GNAT family N-acetyltransferase [Vagococcus lutrae]